MSAATPEDEAARLRAAALAGSAEAQARYGQALLDGHGVPADAAEGLRWFRMAAKSGHLMAINMIGRCHEKGWGTPPDRDAAARCYKAGAEGGLDWGMYNYAGALGLGSGVDRDEAAATGWFQKAAAMGHAKSITVVGTLHEEGRLTPRDMAKAADCYARGAEGGDFRGQFHHARLLAEGGRVDEALAWIARAAEAATPEFRARMKAYLAASGVAALEQAGARL
ncbi:MAG: hypothetical protein JWO65_253 [Sphingomonas bacterium]|nr:hypothetical protein [Sphingomonas bacterium]